VTGHGLEPPSRRAKPKGPALACTLTTPENPGRPNPTRPPLGREGPGQAYRLYTHDAFKALAPTTPPEILRSNLASTVRARRGPAPVGAGQLGGWPAPARGCAAPSGRRGREGGGCGKVPLDKEGPFQLHTGQGKKQPPPLLAACLAPRAPLARPSPPAPHRKGECLVKRPTRAACVPAPSPPCPPLVNLLPLSRLPLISLLYPACPPPPRLQVLQLKALGVDDVVGFDFMDKPPTAAIVRCDSEGCELRAPMLAWHQCLMSTARCRGANAHAPRPSRQAGAGLSQLAMGMRNCHRPRLTAWPGWRMFLPAPFSRPAGPSPPRLPRPRPRSLELLLALGALDSNGRLTEDVGQPMARLPVDPMFAKVCRSRESPTPCSLLSFGDTRAHTPCACAPTTAAAAGAARVGAPRLRRRGNAGGGHGVDGQHLLHASVSRPAGAATRLTSRREVRTCQPPAGAGTPGGADQTWDSVQPTHGLPLPLSRPGPAPPCPTPLLPSPLPPSCHPATSGTRSTRCGASLSRPRATTSRCWLCCGRTFRWGSRSRS
jgi:hypothetical protein